MLRRHKIALIVLAALVIVMTGLHFFLTEKSAYILKKFVSQASQGNYELETRSVRYNYFSEVIQATGLRIHRVVSDSTRQSYELDADTLRVELRSIWPLIFKKSLDIQDLALVNPNLIIRGKNKSTKTDTAEFNLHDDLVLIQEKITQVIHDLRMEIFRVDNLSLQLDAGHGKYFKIDNIFLHIDQLFADVAAMKKGDNLELQGEIHLWLDKPNIVYPDSNLAVTLDHFDWQSRARNLTIENIAFSWRQQRELLDSIRVQLHAVTFSKFQWATWINNGHLFFDSIAASQGELFVQKYNPTLKKDTLIKNRRGILYLVSPVYVNHFDIRQLRSTVQVMMKGGPVSGSMEGDSLKIKDLEVDVNKENPIQLDSLDLAIRGFSGESREQHWETSFASFRILKNHVLLKNYQLKTKNPGPPNLISVPQLDMSGLSVPDLALGKLVIKQVVLESPFVQVITGEKVLRSKRAYQPLKESFPFLNIQSILVRNGSYTSIDQKTGRASVEVKGINGHIFANKLIAARSMNDFPGASGILHLESMQLNLRKMKVTLHDVQLDPVKNAVDLAKASLNLSDQRGSIRFDGVHLILDSVQQLIEGRKSLYLGSVQVDSGNINLDLKKSTDKTATGGEDFPIYISSFTLRNTGINIKKEELQFRSFVHSLIIFNLNNDNQEFAWERLQAQLGASSAINGDFSSRAKSIHLNSADESTIEGIEFEQQKEGRKLSIRLPALGFRWPVTHSKISEWHIPLIDVRGPEIIYNADQSAQTNVTATVSPKPAKALDFRLDSIRISQPKITVSNIRDTNQLNGKMEGKQIDLSSVRYSRNPDSPWVLEVGGLNVKAGNTQFQQNGGLRLSFADLEASIKGFHKNGAVKPVSFSIDQLALLGFQFDQSKPGKQTTINSTLISLTAPTPVLTDKDSLLHTIYSMPSLRVEGTDVKLLNAANTIRFHNVHANLPARSFGLDSFSLQPNISRDSFFAAQRFEKDYITVRSGAVEAVGVNIIKDNHDTGFSIHRLYADQFYIKPERDKRRPDDTTAYRPLLARMLQKIPFHFAIDSMNLQRSEVMHHVIAEKSGEEATIFFTDMHGWITDIRNFRLSPHDSLRIRVYAKLMGKGDLYMRFRQSYTDTLQGFLMTARMGPFPMPDLDSILVPLTRIRITHGQIDTLWLLARANDLFAFGTMEINYHSLHVEKLDKNEKKQGFISWLANIIVRKRNRKKGTIYVERIQDKAIFNYWGKIALSGLLTNIRVASNKKNKKKYEAALKKYQLPPHPFDDDD